MEESKLSRFCTRGSETQGIMVWLTHRSQQGVPTNKEQNCSVQNALLVLQTWSQTSRGGAVISPPLACGSKTEERLANRPSGASKRTLRQRHKYLFWDNSSELHVSFDNNKGIFSY